MSVTTTEEYKHDPSKGVTIPNGSIHLIETTHVQAELKIRRDFTVCRQAFLSVAICYWQNHSNGARNKQGQIFDDRE